MLRIGADLPAHGKLRSLQRLLLCMRLLIVLSIIFMVIACTPFYQAPKNSTPAPAHRVTWDGYSLFIDGRRLVIWSGEFHYWRLPSPALWRDVLEKMKAAGFNTVSIYFDWAYHSPQPGVYDFSGIRDVNRLLTITEQVGLYVIARPGPYINAETDAGGFPGWLLTQKGRARSSAPDYTAAYMDWLTHIDRILVPHQITHHGTIILYQVENEYTFGPLDPTYMQQLEAKVRADGIDVPLDHNDANLRGTWASGPGAVNLYAFDSYPQGFNCSDPQKWASVPTGFARAHNYSPDTPIFIGEFQGGSFDPWGGPGFDKCRQLTGPDFINVFYKNDLAQGATLINSYMTYGGTSWGWLPDPDVYSSYDYGAAIDEAGQLTTKYYAMKRIGYMLQAVAPIAKTQLASDASVTDNSIDLIERINPDMHTHFFFLRHADSTSTANDTFHLAFSGPDGTYTIPQQPGTALHLNGRDSKILIAGYNLGAQRLVYSTSELLTQTTIDNRDIAVLYGRAGEDGETVLRYAKRPAVSVLSGSAAVTYNAATGDLRLNYVHSGLTEVLIQGGKRDLLLLLGTDDIASRFWLDQTGRGPVLVYGPYLVRSASSSGSTLALSGETDSATKLLLFAPRSISAITWDSRNLSTTTDNAAAYTASLPGPAPITLPALANWRFKAESPEVNPAFDDSSWKPAQADKLPMDNYGFHYGDVWYRGRFTATGKETGLALDGEGGPNGLYSVWMNGTFLGTQSSGPHIFPIPAGSLKPGSTVEFSVLVENMGHNEDFSSNDTQKEPRGLVSATLPGSSAALSWKIQGARGGDLTDPMRGPFNNGGLYGERNGWYLPGYNDATWTPVTLPHRWSAAGIPPGIGWYRTSFTLSVPASMDVPIGLHIADSVYHYRALIFVNGWLVGRYWNTVGPQSTYYLTAGILNTSGKNEVAIAVWGLDEQGGGLGSVSLSAYGTAPGRNASVVVNHPIAQAWGGQHSSAQERQPGPTSPEEIAETLRGYAREGLSHVQVWLTPSTLAGLEWFKAVLDLLDNNEA
jgi:beta-galactosidase GanA